MEGSRVERCAIQQFEGLWGVSRLIGRSVWSGVEVKTPRKTDGERL